MTEGLFRPCRYPLSEMKAGAFFNIGHVTAAVPPGANAITLATPGMPDRMVRETKLLVFRKNPRRPPADNDDDIAFLAVADRIEVMDHPAFEALDPLDPAETISTVA